MNRLFPFILIILDICAAAVYACGGDAKRAIYWLSAASLTLCVTV